MDLRQLLTAGHEQLQTEHSQHEAEVAGHPRVGSIGVVAPDGTIYGTCHRISLARSLGIESRGDYNTGIMWRAGEANEDTWTKVLQAAQRGGAWAGKLLRHDEVKVDREIPGVPQSVLGHPDIVLADDLGVAQLGLELKGIFGESTAVQVYFESRPKNENLIQAAGYSYFHGRMPYALCYTNANWIKLQIWDQRKYGVKHIKPFDRIFFLEWRDDVLWYRDETKSDWVRTVITPQGIEDYYRLREEMKANQDLGPRPSGDYVDGTRTKWADGACGLCAFKSACDRYDRNRDYAAWIDDAKAICETTEESSAG